MAHKEIDLPISEVAGWLSEIETLRADIICFLGTP